MFKTRLACWFGPCHKAGHEQANSTRAKTGKVLAPPSTLQPYSQSPGTPTAARACGGGEELHLPSVQPRGQFQCLRHVCNGLAFAIEQDERFPVKIGDFLQ